MSAVVVPLVYVLCFVAVVMMVQVAAGAIFQATDQSQRVNRRLTMLDRGMSRDEVFATLVRRGAPAGLTRTAWLSDLWDRFSVFCRQAGLSIVPQRVLLWTGGAAGVLWLVALFMARAADPVSLLVGALGSLIGAVLVAGIGAWLWLGRLRKRRLGKIEEQLPTALDIVGRALRAGHPVMSAIHLAADELGDPLGSEFGLVVDETTYGIEFETALANLGRRTGSDDARFFAVSINIQSETGGNLAEILQGLATVIRGRRTLAQRVRSLSSEGRTSALVISVLPVLALGVQLLTHPTVYTEKFSDPIFWPAVAITAVVYAVGWLIIYRIINFRY